MEKRCFRCGVTKALSEFYVHAGMVDGHLGKCKACTKADVQLRYEAKRAEISEYDRRRYQQPERKAAALVYQKTRRMRHPEKYKAWNAVNNALRDGKLKKQPCKHCGTTRRVQAHHPDYSRPLDVEWVCFVCHREVEHGQTVTIPFF